MEQVMTAAADRGEALGRAIELSVQLQDAVARTMEEFEKVPAFLRPLAQNRFKEKTGMSVGDWAGSADQLAALLKRMAQGDQGVWAEFSGVYPQFREAMVRLGDYCRVVPDELALLIKDGDKLAKVRQVMEAREGLLRSLVATLDEVLAKPDAG